MTAEILAVGSELLSGSITNTNAREISRALSAIGIATAAHTVVGDDPASLRAAIGIARKRADILITTGGLGPTYDDVTKDILCEVFGREPEFHEEVAQGIRGFYETSLHTPMPENNLRLAHLPAGCTVFPNAVGTAPGCAFEEEGLHVLMLPGPPYEMRTMLHGHALPYLRALSTGVTVSHDIMTFGIRESRIDELLHDRMAAMANPSLAPYAKPSEVCLRATARAASAEDAEALLAPVIAHVREILGDHVYGCDVSGLPEACFHLLKEKGLTFATAESCTGGQVAGRITAFPGSSSVYRGGVVSYWSEVKRDALGVPWTLIEEHGAVSDPCARAMAEGARKLTGADLAVSVTGVAGPDSDERGNPVGLVFIALATPEGTFCRRTENGSRRRCLIQEVSVNHAYDMIRRYLTGLPVA
jgi:nicotinamide-nucleotide amidase